ncbi:MAG: CYTH domain-containing protein [Bacteroidales bacterium]
MQVKEIERKFLVKKLPETYRKYPSSKLIQGYVVATDDGLEVRIRKEEKKSYLTVKSAGDLKRDEIEIELTDQQLQVLWPLTKGRRVQKIRYKLRWNKRLVCLDIYGGNLEGLKVAEVEFNSVKEANNFTPPSWFGKEITYDDRYKNRNFAVSGKPLGERKRKKN